MSILQFTTLDEDPMVTSFSRPLTVSELRLMKAESNRKLFSDPTPMDFRPRNLERQRRSSSSFTCAPVDSTGSLHPSP